MSEHEEQVYDEIFRMIEEEGRYEAVHIAPEVLKDESKEDEGGDGCITAPVDTWPCCSRCGISDEPLWDFKHQVWCGECLLFIGGHNEPEEEGKRMCVGCKLQFPIKGWEGPYCIDCKLMKNTSCSIVL